ncbi:hypothetical protein BRADI_3g12245v3 [Brachypodium distachyon]|uniref:Uncharacterized protein n=1 Tax=Brachypodium distachyon TaxID=15368 RepID=A0A0Q3LQ51_BRADI|nr:hypothetical protein BRADI_3g12245v3 [Brachypodium distachyon]
MVTILRTAQRAYTASKISNFDMIYLKLCVLPRFNMNRLISYKSSMNVSEQLNKKVDDHRLQLTLRSGILSNSYIKNHKIPTEEN